MTQLPNANAVVVDGAKVFGYLLDAANPQNGGKVTFFEAFGFSKTYWTALAAALRDHPVQNDVIEVRQSPHGTKYVVKCMIATPDLRNPCIKTIWIVDAGRAVPRFLTAYP